MTPVRARCFERTVYHHYSKKVLEENLTVTQYAYWEGCSCTDALIQIQYAVNSRYSGHLRDRDLLSVIAGVYFSQTSVT